MCGERRCAQRSSNICGRVLPTGRVSGIPAEVRGQRGSKTHGVLVIFAWPATALWVKRRNFQKKFYFFSKNPLHRRKCCGIIILGCERLVQIKSKLRKPRYALMREVAAALQSAGRVFPRSMSDLRTGRKNYGCEGICTALHSAARTNFHLLCDDSFRCNCEMARFAGFCHAKQLNTRKRV